MVEREQQKNIPQHFILKGCTKMKAVTHFEKIRISWESNDRESLRFGNIGAEGRQHLLYFVTQTETEQKTHHAIVCS